MSYEWMIRVLEDLQRFAGQNGMPALAEHLGQAVLLAMAETPDPDTGEAEKPPQGG